MPFKNNYCSNNVICLVANKQKRLSICWIGFFVSFYFIMCLNFMETLSYLTLFCQQNIHFLLFPVLFPLSEGIGPHQAGCRENTKVLSPVTVYIQLFKKELKENQLIFLFTKGGSQTCVCSPGITVLYSKIPYCITSICDIGSIFLN